jgi:hypothetical protein
MIPTHYHCPYDCENPQPFLRDNGTRCCGRCFFEDGEYVEVILCTPETCEGQ